MQNDLQVLIEEIEKLYRSNNYDQIINLLPDEVLEKYKDDKLYAWRGFAWNSKKEFNKAIEDYTRAIELNEKYDIAYSNRGLAWENKNEYEKAIDDYTKAIAVNEKYDYAYFSRGNAWRLKGENDKAIEDYTKAIQLNEKYDNAYNNRGIVWQTKKEYDKAIEDFNKAIQLNGNFPDVYTNRGLAWHTKKEYDKAIEDYNKAIALDEKYVIAFYNRGLAWENKNEYEKAIEDYSTTISLDPKYINAYNNRGNVWIYKYQYDKAIDDYNTVIGLDEKYVFAYYNRGLAWQNKNEYNKAIEDYSKAIALDEKYAFAYYARATVYELTEQLNKAIADYETYIKLANDSSDYYSKVAQSAIEELRKKISNTSYSEIAELVYKIKQLLLFKQECVTHYTGLTAAKAMVLNNSKLRLSEGAFLNDTSEGRELFDYLEFSTVKQKIDKTLAEPFAEKPFIGSFVTDTKYDDLTLWRMYGKEDKIEARGCALTINKEAFLSGLKKSIGGQTDKTALLQTEEQFTFYKVAYINKDKETKFIIPEETKGKQLTKIMGDLKTKLQKVSKEEEINVKELLNSIAFLFKSVEYQYENEVRLIVRGVGFNKTIDANVLPPKVYIELVDISSALTKVTFGPKVERPDEWAAAFNYQIKKDNPNSNIEIVISHLPFK